METKSRQRDLEKLSGNSGVNDFIVTNDVKNMFTSLYMYKTYIYHQKNIIFLQNYNKKTNFLQ